MFLVTVRNEGEEKKFLWANKKEDDFIQFLPEHFGVEKEAIKVEYIKNGWGEKRKADAFMSDEDRANGCEIGFKIEGDKVNLVKVGNNQTIALKELVLLPCKPWPYNGKIFLGNLSN